MVFNDVSPTFIVPQIDGHFMPVEMAPLVFRSEFFKPLCGTKYACDLLDFQPRQAFLAPEMVFNKISHIALTGPTGQPIRRAEACVFTSFFSQLKADYFFV